MQTAVAPRNRIAELFWASPPRERANPLRGPAPAPKAALVAVGCPKTLWHPTLQTCGELGFCPSPGTPLSPQGHKVTAPASRHRVSTPARPAGTSLPLPQGPHRGVRECLGGTTACASRGGGQQWAVAAARHARLQRGTRWPYSTAR